MRARSFLGIVLSLVLTSAAAADAITSISPSTVDVGDVEIFMTITGTGLAGEVLTLVTFDGPAGTFTLELEGGGSGTQLLVSVPDVVASVAGSVNVTVEAVDNAGSRIIGPAVLEVIGVPPTGPPLLGLPNFVLAEAENSRGANVTYFANAVSQITGEEVPVVCTPESGSLFLFGFTAVSCSATEGDQTSTGGFMVLVQDSTPPEITVGDSHIITDDPVVNYETPTAVDSVDGAVPVICNPASGSTFPQGTTFVLCTATDVHDNANAAVFRVTVTGGGTPPVIEVPNNIVVEATSTAGAVVTYTVDAGEYTVTCNPPSGSTFALGTVDVTCTASNSFGTTTEQFSVSVIDTTGPVLNLPDIDLEATSPAGAVGTFDIAGNDAVDGTVTAVCVISGFEEDETPTPASGYLYPFGPTQVECTAVDSRDNVSFDTFIVTVADTTGPMVSVSASPNTLWPPNHQMVPITVTVVASDAVDPAPVSQIVSVASNQPINGTGDGDVAPDWEITGPLTLKLRAERSSGVDRVYTITIGTSDSSGNVTMSAAEVRVTAPRGKR